MSFLFLATEDGFIAWRHYGPRDTEGRGDLGQVRLAEQRAPAAGEIDEPVGEGEAQGLADVRQRHAPGSGAPTG